MATRNVAAGDRSTGRFALTAATVDTINFADGAAAGTMQIMSDGTADVFLTVDGTTPAVDGSKSLRIPAGGVSVTSFRTYTGSVKLISSGTPTLSVQVG